MAPSRSALNKFRWVNDPDEALDMAYDYDHDEDAQYDDYVTSCHEAGEVPLPR